MKVVRGPNRHIHPTKQSVTRFPKDKDSSPERFMFARSLNFFEAFLKTPISITSSACFSQSLQVLATDQGIFTMLVYHP